MPIISKFYGIEIKMYFIQNEHNPPHIHAFYGEYVSIININTLEEIEGNLPSKALKIVREWIEINKSEILEIWKTQKFKKIKPIE